MEGSWAFYDDFLFDYDVTDIRYLNIEKAKWNWVWGMLYYNYLFVPYMRESLLKALKVMCYLTCLSSKREMFDN